MGRKMKEKCIAIGNFENGANIVYKQGHNVYKTQRHPSYTKQNGNLSGSIVSVQYLQLKQDIGSLLKSFQRKVIKMYEGLHNEYYKEELKFLWQQQQTL